VRLFGLKPTGQYLTKKAILTLLLKTKAILALDNQIGCLAAMVGQARFSSFKLNAPGVHKKSQPKLLKFITILDWLFF
jgi:hypothetical protein